MRLHERLCKGLKKGVCEIMPEFYTVLVPDCLYRGKCYEMVPCSAGEKGNRMLIGIMGYARSGKNTFATLLSKIVGEGRTVTELSFAAKLKSELCTMLRAVGVDTSDIFLSKKELWRPMMVAWGKQRRTIYPNYWVDPVIKCYKKDNEYAHQRCRTYLYNNRCQIFK